MMLAALLAVAVSGPVTVEAERLGSIPRDCRLDQGQAADGVDLSELEEFAECLTELEPERGGDLARGVDLFRLALELSQTDTSLPPSIGDMRYQIVRAYGINGDTAGMLREAETLRGFLDSIPSLRCAIFDRLAVQIEDWDQFESAAALADRFDLASCPRYVPRDGWTGRPRPAFYERWFGNQLLAMQERPFSEPGLLDGHSQRFRLTVLPTFSPGFSARIDKPSNGRSRLHWVILDGAGGYSPGKVAQRGDRLLDSREVFLLDRALRRADLAVMPMQEPRQLESVDPETGEKLITVCADGTHWLFELLTENGTTFVERSFCGYENDDLARLIETTYALMPAAMTGEPEE